MLLRQRGKRIDNRRGTPEARQNKESLEEPEEEKGPNKGHLWWADEYDVAIRDDPRRMWMDADNCIIKKRHFWTILALRNSSELDLLKSVYKIITDQPILIN